MSHENINFGQTVVGCETLPALRPYLEQDRFQRVAATSLAAVMAVGLPATEQRAHAETPPPPTVESVVEPLLAPKQTDAQPTPPNTVRGATLRIFVSPEGKDDAKSGLSPVSPIRTLVQAQKILKTNKVSDTNVEILVDADKGTYRHQGEIHWSYSIKDTDQDGKDEKYNLTIKSADKGKQATFVGNGSQANFMRITGDNVHVEDVKAKRFRGSAFSVTGDVESVATPNGHPLIRPTANSVDGVSFSNVHVEDIGNEPNNIKHKIGYGAFIFRNAKNWVVKNSRIKNLNNRKEWGRKIHAVYATTGSKGTFKDNIVEDVAGSPLKSRNNSPIVASDNVFINTGAEAVYLDSYQPTNECPTEGSKLLDNVADTTFGGTTKVPWVKLRFGDNRRAKRQNPACPPLDGPRVSTDGNVRSKKMR